ncbi:hypothetical protein GMMP15_950001 [Candidatus Magnetomoraceae bacterium gMMP-15]
MEIKPDDHEAWNNLGVFYQKQGAEDLASKYFNIRNAIMTTDMDQAEPDDWFLVASDVWAAYQRWEETERCLQKVLETEPEHIEALTLAAETALELDKLSEADTYLKKVEKLAPDYTPLCYPLSQYLVKQGRPDEAREKLREYYDSAYGYDYQTEMKFLERFENLNDADYAKRCYIGASRSHVNTEETEYHYARILRRMKGELTEARKTIKNLLQAEAIKMPEIYIFDAELALETGDFIRCRNNLALAKEHKNFKSLSPKEKESWKHINEICL